MTMTFKEAYGVLNKHAQTLRAQQEPNIDDLLRVVTESVDAYKACKERIDAVEAALEQALADPAVAAARQDQDDEPADAPAERPRPTASRPAGRPAPSDPVKRPTGFDDMDDDIPF